MDEVAGNSDAKDDSLRPLFDAIRQEARYVFSVMLLKKLNIREMIGSGKAEFSYGLLSANRETLDLV